MANDFSGLPAGSVVLNMDNGALLVDAMGGNNWADNNTVGQNVDAKQGDRSGDFEGDVDEYLSQTDVNLPAGFPFKNGDAVKKLTACMWLKFESFDQANDALISKWENNKRSFALLSGDTAGSDYFKFFLGYGGGDNTEVVRIFGTAWVTSIWYHVGFTYQDSDKSYKIRIWDDNAGALLGGAEETGNSTNNMNIEDAGVGIGAFLSGVTTNTHDGLLDEMVIIPDILSSADIDLIRQGIYGAAAGGIVPILEHHYRMMRNQ